MTWLVVGLVIGAFVPGIVRWYLRSRRDRVTTIATGQGDLPRDRTQEALLAAFRPDEVAESEDVRRDDQRIMADALRDIARRRDAEAAILWVLDEEVGGVPVPVASSADDARSSQTPASL